MKNYTILKHFHRPISFPPFFKGFGFVDKPVEITSKVTFHDDCKYVLAPSTDRFDWITPSVDQFDWNKLEGLAFGLFGIHRNSLRFGWRWNVQLEQIEISVLRYYINEQNKQVVERSCLTRVDLNTEHEFKIKTRPMKLDKGTLIECSMFIDGVLVYRCIQMEYISIYDLRMPTFRFGCGIYFGGNCRAPHTMHITKKTKIKRLE